jgi:hypothetical protein
MKTSLPKLRKLIKEYARGVPSFSVTQIAESCSEDVKRLIVNHINMTSPSQQERTYMLAQMNHMLEELEKEIKDVIDTKLSNFFNRSTR